MTTAQIIISAIQIMLASSSFTLAVVVAYRTAHEKNKEPFSVTDLQSVADSKWVTPDTREAARQELVRKTNTLEIRAEISSLGEFEEVVIEKLRTRHSGLLRFKKDEELTSFTSGNGNVGTMYSFFPWTEIICLASLLSFCWTGYVLFSSMSTIFPFAAAGFTMGVLVSWMVFLFSFWNSLRRGKLTYQYIRAAEKLTGKEYTKQFLSVTRMRHTVGKWIASHPKIGQHI